LSDGRLLFLRLVGVPLMDSYASVLYTIEADGSGLERVGILEGRAFAVYALAVSPDDRYVAYNHNAPDNDDRNGLWIYDLEEGEARQLFQTEEAYGGADVPMVMAFSPDGQYVLSINNWLDLMVGERTPENSPVRITPVDGSGEPFLVDDEVMVWTAAWAPDRPGLAYIVSDPSNPDISGLYLSSAPGENGELVLPGTFLSVNVMEQSLPFAQNGAILLFRASEPGMVIVYVR
jgi:dipeptidyl aminopeptidase/acylaminoacyl peptidase